MWSFARSAVRAYRGSFIGSFLIVLTGAALLTANGVFLETGLRMDLPLLTTLASSFAGTAMLVVVLVVASTFASALRQRNAQFALLRAVGATPRQVRSMVTGEVAIVFAIAAPLGAIPGLFAANLLTPVLVNGGMVPAGLDLAISPLPVLGALVLLFPTALLAARLAARKVTRVSPTAAVRESTVESSRLSTARRITALSLLAGGLGVAATPLFMPGTIGSAMGATSAFLLISAAAVGGPAIVGAVARRAARGSSKNASVLLALVNSRGFSRRLTAAIIPLALFLSLGTIQSGVNGSVVDAAGLQLREGLGSSVVVTSGVTAVPENAVGSAAVAAEVKTEDEDLGIAWEQSGVTALSGSPAGILDPDVTAGSLEELTTPNTIAVSSESLFMSGLGIGDTIDLRFGSVEVSPTIVAIYERGLGFGEYLVNVVSLPEAPAAYDLVYASDAGDVAGLPSMTVDEYVEATVAGAASQQELGMILLLVLMGFVAIAAANTLVMLTSARRPEFALLSRIGTTRGQLTSMITLESVFVIATALVIGTLSVLPALLGVSYGMLGGFSLAIEWPVYGALAAVVVLIAGVAMVGAARFGGRVRV